ncbi:MAG: hypothetical protein KGR26_07405, partial [Cyanobacteria bacterium REEB65]|nr:hypothetical protein [Cyanobacteria bacterium REEB65]
MAIATAPVNASQRVRAVLWSSVASSTTAQQNSALPALDWYLMPEAFSAPLVQQACARYGLQPGDTVLDPFSGTGTTVLTAKLSGLCGLGLEANPFLAWAAGVKSKLDVPAKRFARARQRVLDRIGDLGAAPEVALPDMPRVDKWLTPKIAYKVVALREAILAESSEPERDLLLLALASLLRAVGNLKLTAHAFGTVSIRADAPVAQLFRDKTAKMAADLQALESLESAGSLGSARVLRGDARQLDLTDPALPAKLAITSPPYLNNLDYTMQTRLELFFLGHVANLGDVR